MAVLSGGSADPWETVTRFSGADAILDAQSAALPQPDQMCGPFAARAALHALLELGPVPPLAEIAQRSGTRVWPADAPADRPPGAPWAPLGWDELPHAASHEESGTDAAGLAAGIIAVTRGAVAVVPVRHALPGPWPAEAVLGLLADIAAAPYPTGVVANLATGPVADTVGDAADWDVGHFVVLWGLDGVGRRVAIADSYAETTGHGAPPGCRLVTAEALGEALGQGPGRGLLLLTGPEHAVLLGERAVALGMVLETWHT